MSMAGRRSTTRALRQPPPGGFSRLLGDRVRLSRNTARLPQEGEKAVTLLVERRTIGFGNRRTPADLYPPGVLGDAIDAEFIMQVGSARQASRAYVTDHLALLDPDTTADLAGKPP